MLCNDCSAEGQIPHGRQHTVKPKEQMRGVQTQKEATVIRGNRFGGTIWREEDMAQTVCLRREQREGE